MATSSIDLGSAQEQPLLNSFDRHAHWLVRAVLAGVFLFHGPNNVLGAAGLSEIMGLPVVLILALGAVETAVGVLVLVGGLGYDWATRLGGLLIVPVMAGAIALVHWGQWSFAPSETHPLGGMEFQTVLLVVGLYLAARGNDL